MIRFFINCIIVLAVFCILLGAGWCSLVARSKTKQTPELDTDKPSNVLEGSGGFD